MEPFGETLYAFAAVLLVSAMFLSLAGWAAKQPMKKYGAGYDEVDRGRTSAASLVADGAIASGWRLAWVAGIGLCVVAGAIVIYMLVKGLQYLRPDLLFSHPQAEIDQSKAGGFFDPLIGTFLLTVMGTALAILPGIATAVWLSEYARPFWLARAVESAVEVVAGTPSIVLAIFGLIVFSNGLFGSLSFTAEGGAVFGRSFFAASAMMALIALPLIVGATREALQAIPRHVREASYALGKTKAATIRRVLLPAAPPWHRDRHGARHGPDRGRHGDRGDPARRVAAAHRRRRRRAVRHAARHGLDAHQLRVRELPGRARATRREKAYAAAFVLLLIVMLLNFVVDLVSRRRSGSVMEPVVPPPIRRILIEGRADDRRAPARPATVMRPRPTAASRSTR